MVVVEKVGKTEKPGNSRIPEPSKTQVERNIQAEAKNCQTKGRLQYWVVKCVCHGGGNKYVQRGCNCGGTKPNYHSQRREQITKQTWDPRSGQYRITGR